MADDRKIEGPALFKIPDPTRMTVTPKDLRGRKALKKIVTVTPEALALARAKRNAIQVGARRVTPADRDRFVRIGQAMSEKNRLQMREHMALTPAARFRKSLRYFED